MNNSWGIWKFFCDWVAGMFYEIQTQHSDLKLFKLNPGVFSKASPHKNY